MKPLILVTLLVEKD